LPELKVQSQNINPREISHHIDDGYCLDYFTLVHCKVVGGVDMNFLGDEQPTQVLVENKMYQLAPDSDVDKLSVHISRKVENLKRLIHHDLVNKRYLLDKENSDASNRYSLEATGQQNRVEYYANNLESDPDSVTLIKLPR
jgi:hypothetical protein